MPLICLSLTAHTIDENLAVLDLYRGHVDLVELRADYLDPSEKFRIRGFPGRAGLPAILTVRRKADGGVFEEGEGVRLVMIAKALAYASDNREANFAFVDLESDFRVPAIEEACRIFGTKVIRSFHDPKGMPADLAAAWNSVSDNPEELPKLALACPSSHDFLRLYKFTEKLPKRDRVIVGMGDFGFPSRLLAARMGSFLSYSSAISAGLPGAAPGQLDPEDLVKTFRFRDIRASTEVYALAGGKASIGARSPQLHNSAFRSVGMDAVYFPIPTEDASTFLAILDMLGGKGAAVTIPHKESILPFLAGLSPEAEAIGACNTLEKRSEGWFGHNTDAAGFESALFEFMHRRDFAGLRATVIGAGGAAKAVAYALARLGAACLVVNRSLPKAKALAREYGFAWAANDERSAELVADHADLIVNATSVGMDGGTPGDPLEWYDFLGREAVFDLIYKPERTAFLQRARTAGCHVVNGLPMLRYQAAEQFKIWTGGEPPSAYFE